MTILAITLLAGSFALSAILTAVVKKLANLTGFVAHPTEDRFHRSIVPLGGGIAIFATIAMIMLAAITAVKLLLVPGRLDWLGESVTIHTAGFLSKIGQLTTILLCVSGLF